MQELLCLVSGINDGILDEIFKRLFRDNNIKVIESATEENELKNLININVNYLLINKDNNKLPEEYKCIFSKNKELVLFELLDNGKSIAFYIHNIGCDELSRIIKAIERM